MSTVLQNEGGNYVGKGEVRNSNRRKSAGGRFYQDSNSLYTGLTHELRRSVSMCSAKIREVHASSSPVDLMTKLASTVRMAASGGGFAWDITTAGRAWDQICCTAPLVPYGGNVLDSETTSLELFLTRPQQIIRIPAVVKSTSDRFCHYKSRLKDVDTKAILLCTVLERNYFLSFGI